MFRLNSAPRPSPLSFRHRGIINRYFSTLSNYISIFSPNTSMPSWDRLIRFVSTDGKTLRGEPILPSPDFDVGTTTEETKLQAKVISVANNDIFDETTKVTDEVVTVKTLLGPVTTAEVPIIRCIGLNFIKHSK
jgi:hypothetical protein